jgi:hypothetical protein
MRGIGGTAKEGQELRRVNFELMIIALGMMLLILAILLRVLGLV